MVPFSSQQVNHRTCRAIASSNVEPAEVDHARESAAGRKVPGYRACQRKRRTDEAIRPDARLSHGGGLFARILLTEGCTPVGELRGAFATGAGRQLLSTRGRMDGQSLIHLR